MMGNEIKRTIDECIECDACKKNCDFLTKYDMNLLDFCSREDLRYSCFLCDRCKKVCPKDLSGKDISIELRKQNPKGTLLTSFMKNKYKLRNNSREESKTLLFMGCNYPGFLPNTTEKMIQICEEHGIDFSIDCCKKPVNDMGANPKMKYVDKLFADKGVSRVICCCPNCYHFLKGRNKNIQIMDPYEFLLEIGIGNKIEEEANVFFPCSERFDTPIFDHIKEFATSLKISTYRKINCCGMGGGAIKYEKDIVINSHEKMKLIGAKNVYTYCSTCTGTFEASGINNVKNFLSEILGVHEKGSSDYTKNVMKIKWRKHNVK